MKQQHTNEIAQRQADLSERLSRGSRARVAGRMLAGGNESFDLSERVKATAFGGIGLVHRLVRQIGLADLIDESVHVFDGPSPYSVSDHVLNLAYNAVCGGKTLDDLELRRQDESYMDALGATRVPDPTTAGDFLRRFTRSDIDDLSEAINEVRARAWKKQGKGFFKRAVIEVDGTLVGTDAECKEGIDMSYKGIWGYAPLVVSLANTGEILYTRNRPGNKTSHEGCFDYLDPAVEVARDGGFRKVRLRGDTAFALTEDFDHWTKNKVEFVFGLSAHQHLVKIAEGFDEAEWKGLRRKRCTKGVRRKHRIKRDIITERGYKHLELAKEEYTEFRHQPKKCSQPYRIVVLRKTIKVSKGEALLIPELRYHFYITNVRRSTLPARQVIREANSRCNQENLIEQAKNGVHAMRMPCDTLLANDAHMVITCLALNLKAWMAILWPNKQMGDELARMEFRRFMSAVIEIPCQVVETARGVVHRFLAVTDWLPEVLKTHASWKRLRFG